MNLQPSHSPGYYAWRRFRRNRAAFWGLIFIVVLSLLVIPGYLILPDQTPDANRQMVEAETRPPGFSVNVLNVRRQEDIRQSFIKTLLVGSSSPFTPHPISSWQFKGDSLIVQPYTGSPDAEKEVYLLPEVLYGAERSTIQNPGRGSISFVTASGKTQTASIAEMQRQIEKENIVKRTFWLGTDRFGRDMLSRLLLGARVSLAVGLISVIISLFIGIFLGSLAGFFGGWVDLFIQWLINVVWSIPTFLLVMAIALVLGRGFWQVFIAIGLTMWVDVARMVRGQILGVRELEYVQAARALGYRTPRIIFRHILPNITGPVLVIAAANFATAILLEAGLSFLGLGVQPPTPSWGVMINDSYAYIMLGAAYLALLPGLAIMLLVLSFNMLGNGLRDAVDVRR
jgi:peptide/nickel transport system permease protein